MLKNLKIRGRLYFLRGIYETGDLAKEYADKEKKRKRHWFIRETVRGVIFPETVFCVYSTKSKEDLVNG